MSVKNVSASMMRGDGASYARMNPASIDPDQTLSAVILYTAIGYGDLVLAPE